MSRSKTEAPEQIVHPIPPVFDSGSRILILGSFPSVKSRESGFFYGHPQNRFWKVLSHVTGEETPVEIPEKEAFLRRNHIAVWDVIAACTITGSSDASIRNVRPNELSRILSTARIRQIFCNGAASHRLYETYQRKVTGREAIRLPSTSPANAAWSLERLCEEWKICQRYLQDETAAEGGTCPGGEAYERI